MWYEIIPSCAIIMAAVSLPQVIIFNLNKVVMGNGFRRDLNDVFDRRLYLRDKRLTNDPYQMNGLDSIPDEEKS